jgi:hypothetical protein
MGMNIRSGLLGVVLLCVGSLGCGGEGDAVQIHAEIESGDIFVVGEFTAEGAGFCPAGIALPSRADPVEESDGRQSFIQVQFECADESGIFLIETVVDLPYELVDDPPEGPVGGEVTWTLASGLGDYSTLSGSGEVTIKIDGGVYVFDGTLSID